MQQAATPFYGFFDGKGGIYVQDMQGQRQVGVSMERYQEMERVANEAVAKAEDYHKQLVDAGLIQPRRSPEEQLADLTGQVGAMMQQFGVMTQQNMALSQQVSDLNQKITALTGGKNDESSQHSQDIDPSLPPGGGQNSPDHPSSERVIIGIMPLSSSWMACVALDGMGEHLLLSARGSNPFATLPFFGHGLHGSRWNGRVFPTPTKG